MSLTSVNALPLEAVPDVPVPDGFELVDDQLVQKPMGAEASQISVKALSLIEAYVASRNLGHVFDSDCGYQIFKHAPKKVRKPDGSFVARGRLPDERPPRGNMRIPPDLAIEVISPNDLAEDVEARVNDYLGAGTRLMWLLYPATHAIWVVCQDGSGARLKGEQVVSGEAVIPDFSSPASAFFPAPPA
jgi:Uma2 family endonuclease